MPNDNVTGGARPTIYDVANRAGVSKSTVSRVIRGDSHVSDIARQAIEAAIAELGYVPSQAARTLRAAREPTVGILTRNIDAPAYAKLNHQLHMRLRDAGYYLVHEAIAGRHPINETELLDNLLSLKVEYLLVATGSFPSAQLRRYARQVPLIVIGRPEPDPAMHNIAYDQKLHGKMTAEYLYELGHRTIAVQTVDERFSLGSYVRTKEISRRARELGMTVHCSNVSGKVDYDDVINRVIRGYGVTAIACLYDRYLLKMWRRLEAYGISVGNEVSLIGSDGLLDGADILGISTIRLPVELLADRTVQIIDLLREDPQIPPVRELIPGWLLHGNTAQAPPQ